MNVTSEILSTHPAKPTHHHEEITAAIAACFDCEAATVMCADACIGEEAIADLRQCIRLNLDCADISSATGRLIARQAHPEPSLWRATLQACIEACKSAAEECAKHESRYEHCRVCREACQRCEQACRTALDAMPSGGAESRH